MGLALPLLTVVVGVLIGMVGIGGVLLPPGIVALSGLTANEATATSTWAFMLTGLVGTLAYAWRGAVPWGMLGRLSLGVVPAAFLGALVNATLPAVVVLLGLAALTLGVGVQQLQPRVSRQVRDDLGGATLVGIGALVGFGSALTGTGGPVLLVPILLMLGVTPLRAIAVSQAVQLPVVVAGSAGYLQAEGLRRIVAVACLAAGVLLVVRVIV